MLFQRSNNRKGFTLFELMIVIFIIGVSAATFISIIIKSAVDSEVSAPEKISIQQEQKVAIEKPSVAPKQKEVTKQSEDIKKL